MSWETSIKKRTVGSKEWQYSRMIKHKKIDQLIKKNDAKIAELQEANANLRARKIKIDQQMQYDKWERDSE